MGRFSTLLVACLACGCSGSSPGGSKPVDPDAIRRACAMEVSCFAMPPLTPGGNCVSDFEYGLATGAGIFFGPSASDLARYVQCATSASGCTAVLDCASKNHGPDWCKAHPNPTCDGDTVVDCLDGWGLELTDCAALGMHCATANGASSCSDGNACDANAMAHCAGNHLVSCDYTTKFEASVDCGTTWGGGGVCVSRTMGTSSFTGCLPPPSAGCTKDGATCDGKAAVLCSYGSMIRVDCGQFASHCAVDAMGNFTCVPDASSCTTMTPDACNGNALEICANGNLVATPCSDIGLATCGTAGGSARCM